MKQKTMAVSEDTYDQVMRRKQAMERKESRPVSLREALDSLLKDGEKRDE